MLKIFKDIPKVDLEMLIPGGRPKMRFDRGKLGASFANARRIHRVENLERLRFHRREALHRNPALYG